VTSWIFTHGIIIAGTDGHGVFYSSDPQKSWHAVSTGLPHNVRVTAITVQQQLLVLGTYKHGIYLSSDDGAHWQPANTGLENFTVRSLYALGPVLMAGTNGGIYRSSDHGVNWTRQTTTLQINDFDSFSSLIFAATQQGVLRSSDFGITWEPIFGDGAIFEITVSESSIEAMDYFGTVYHTPLKTISWMKVDLFLPFQYSFRPTPNSRQFFWAEWSSLLQGNSIAHRTFNGLPAGVAIATLLETPFGLLAGVVIPGTPK
jgi:hypothetical protein